MSAAMTGCLVAVTIGGTVLLIALGWAFGMAKVADAEPEEDES